jgi:hypothetical protein
VIVIDGAVLVRGGVRVLGVATVADRLIAVHDLPCDPIAVVRLDVLANVRAGGIGGVRLGVRLGVLGEQLHVVAIIHGRLLRVLVE